MILVPILLREDCRVELRLPCDLTPSEAERICRVVTSYVDEAGVFRAPKPTWEAYAASVSGALQ